MTIGFLFWLLMLLWLIFSFVLGLPELRAGRYYWPASGLFIWFLFFLVGWRLFGFPIHE